MHDVQQITVHLLQLIISVRDIEVPAGGSPVSPTESRIFSGKSPVLRSPQGSRSHTRQGALHTQYIRTHLMFKGG